VCALSAQLLSCLAAWGEGVQEKEEEGGEVESLATGLLLRMQGRDL